MKSILLVVTLLISLTSSAEEGQVPFGDRVGDSVVNYNRTTPNIATSGTVREGGLQKLQSLGFRSILDLRTQPEGTDRERQAASDLGFSYRNIAIAREAPTQQQLTQFSRWVENADHYPLLIHCASANRVGALWAMYRITRGVPLTEALLEGRTIGMQPSREVQVRDFAANNDSGSEAADR
jgi:uncharacterized protein (TIGR01244 family)|tara:strand:- start:11673 stop:12215 length:543 start_codon:yes stop_codon:yes gene_type:complete